MTRLFARRIDPRPLGSCGPTSSATAEILAKATIAAALIGAYAAEIPNIPRDGAGTPDAAGLRLRELTEYVYQTIIASKPQPTV